MGVGIEVYFVYMYSRIGMHCTVQEEDSTYMEKGARYIFGCNMERERIILGVRRY